MGKPRNPFAGRHVGGTNKATRQPNTGKKKKQPAAACGSGNAGGGKKRKPKSFLGLLLTGAGFAGMRMLHLAVLLGWAHAYVVVGGHVAV